MSNPPAEPGSPDGTPSPEPIMRLAIGFMAAKHLFAASSLGLFEALAASPATLDELAARTGLTARAARISADAMVALGLLERDDDTYRNSPSAAHYLSGHTREDLRPLLQFWDKISYPAWRTLTETLRGAPHRGLSDLDEHQQQVFSAGVEALLAAPARALTENTDFSTHRRLLDIGGGTGSWSIAVAHRHPHLRATVLDLPAVASIARDRIDAAGMTDRIEVVAADALSDPLPPSHDLVLLANMIHYWSPEQNQLLLARVREAASAGARLLLADFWTDTTHTCPLEASLLAGEFAVHIREGDVYSVDEARDWLARTGWRFLRHVPLAGPQSLIIGEAA